MDTRFRLFPEAASTTADQVDRLYLFLVLVSAFFTILIFVLIFTFVIKYRRRPTVQHSTLGTERFLLLEVTWSLLPLGLTMIMFGWGASLFYQMQRTPEDAITVNVLAKQWMWRLQHSNGKQEINTLHVPVGRPVQLRMISEDVIHSFFVPNFRIKQDVLPNRYTTLWFEATETGRYHLFCAEYCGTEHSNMVGEIIVQDVADYSNWLQGGRSESPEAAGLKLYEQFRCVSCHDNPVAPRCPPLAGLYGRAVQLTDGSTVVADEEYLRNSILNPSSQVVAGYQPIMPSYSGQIGEESIYQLIAYIKSLQPEVPATAGDDSGVSAEAEQQQ